ncbi:Os03g0627900, partial [Oryza sativa Japonica Group]
LGQMFTYAEFSSNNSYQASLKMSPHETLYGRKCRTPLIWTETKERSIFGTNLLKEAEEKVRLIRDRLKVAQSQQKSYADSRRRELTFDIGDYIYLKVSPLRGIKRFKVKGKLAPRYIGPYQIIAKHGEVAYQLALPDYLSDVHPTFHVSQLKKCLRIPEEEISMNTVELNQDLTYPEYPIRILEEAQRTTRTKTIRMFKIQWNHHTEDEATWEREDYLQLEFLYLFEDS